MKTPKTSHYEEEPAEIQNLGAFDMQYFQALEGQDGWMAIGQENCMNQQYFTVYGSKGEKLPGVKKVSDEHYERKFHKVKYVYAFPPEGALWGFTHYSQ